MLKFQGTAFKFGDNINTDYIISSHRKKDTLDTNILKKFIMEDIRPGFYHELKEASILVAGENFGCGSAMEVAAQVVKENNIPVIIAKSFSRSYYRNAINNGIIVIEMDTAQINEGDIINVKIYDDSIIIENVTNNCYTKVPGFRGEIKDILNCGGIIEYMKKNKQKGGGK